MNYLGHWRLGEVVQGRRFDVGRRWLPTRLSAARDLAGVPAAEALKLSHLEMGAYAHLFGSLEACIGVEHAGFFRDVQGRVEAALGFAPDLLPAAPHVASVLRGRHPAAVLLLTTAIEALAQQHYLACFEEDASLDPFAWDILRSHWLEESRRPRLARLDAADAFQRLAPATTDAAIDDFIEILAGLDGVLHIQAHLDLETLPCHIRRDPSPAEQTEILGALLAAKRRAFLECGLDHASVRDLLGLVATATQLERVSEAVRGLLALPA
jgi:hypothetical protein